MLALTAAARRLKSEHRSRAWAVLHVARLSRIDVKDFPTFDELVGANGVRREETDEQQIAHLARLTIAMGGQVRSRSDPKP